MAATATNLRDLDQMVTDVESSATVAEVTRLADRAEVQATAMAAETQSLAARVAAVNSAAEQARRAARELEERARAAREEEQRRLRFEAANRDAALSDALAGARAWATRTTSERRTAAREGIVDRPDQWLRGARTVHVGLGSFHAQGVDGGNVALGFGTADVRWRIASPLFLGLGPIVGLEDGSRGVAVGASAMLGAYLLSLPVPRHRILAGNTWGESGSTTSVLNRHAGLRAGAVLGDGEGRGTVAIELGNTTSIGPFSIALAGQVGLTGITWGLSLSMGFAFTPASEYREIDREANGDAGRAFARGFAARYEAGEVAVSDRLEARWRTREAMVTAVLDEVEPTGPVGNAVMTAAGAEGLECEAYEGRLVVAGEVQAPGTSLVAGTHGRHGLVLLCMSSRSRHAFVGLQYEGEPLVFQQLGARAGSH